MIVLSFQTVEDTDGQASPTAVATADLAPLWLIPQIPT